jgi:hypothetical protein
MKRKRGDRTEGSDPTDTKHEADVICVEDAETD